MDLPSSTQPIAPPPQTPIAPSPTPSSASKTPFLLGFLILVGLALAGGAYLSSRSPQAQSETPAELFSSPSTGADTTLETSTTSETLAYTNAERGFSLNYPANLLILQEGWNALGDNPKGFWLLMLKGPTVNVIVDVRDNPTTAGGEPITDVHQAIQGPSKDITFQSHPAVQVEEPSSDGITSKGIYVLRNGTLWSIFTFVSGDNPADKAAADKLLSSFRFL